MRFRSATCIIALLTLAGCASHVSLEPGPAPPPERYEGRGQPSTAATLGIPPGHLPPPGQCRVWIPGQPPGRQPRADRCSDLERGIPAGAWLVYRPTADKKHVQVSYYDTGRPHVVVAVRVYDASSGRLVRQIRP